MQLLTTRLNVQSLPIAFPNTCRESKIISIYLPNTVNEKAKCYRFWNHGLTREEKVPIFSDTSFFGPEVWARIWTKHKHTSKNKRSGFDSQNSEAQICILIRQRRHGSNITSRFAKSRYELTLNTQFFQPIETSSLPLLLKKRKKKCAEHIDTSVWMLKLWIENRWGLVASFYDQNDLSEYFMNNGCFWFSSQRDHWDKQRGPTTLRRNFLLSVTLNSLSGLTSF